MNADALDKAVEAAARALHTLDRTGFTWDELDEYDKEGTRSDAQHIVEAAARPIAEAAWDEGHEAGMRGEFGYAVVQPVRREGRMSADYEKGYQDGYEDRISSYDLVGGLVGIRSRDYQEGYWTGVDDRLEEDEGG